MSENEEIFFPRLHSAPLGKIELERKIQKVSASNFSIIFIHFQHRNTQETLAVLDRLDLDTDKPSEEEVAKRFGYEDDYYSGGKLLLILNYNSFSLYNNNL